MFMIIVAELYKQLSQQKNVYIFIYHPLSSYHQQYSKMKNMLTFDRVDSNEQSERLSEIHEVAQKHAVKIRKKQRKDIIDQKRRRVEQQDEMDAQQLLTLPSIQSLQNLVEKEHRFHIQIIYQQTNRIGDLPKLRKYLSQDIVKKYQGLIGIARIIKQTPSNIQSIVDGGVIPHLLILLKQFQYPALQYLSLLIVKRVMSQSFYQCERVLDKGLLPLMLDLMKSVHSQIILQTIISLGIMTQYCNRSKHFATDTNCISTLIDISYRIKTDKIFYLTCWVLSNLCLGKALTDFKSIQPAFLFICQNIVGRDRFPKYYQQKCFQTLYIHTVHPKQIELFLGKNILARIVGKLDRLSTSSLSACLQLLFNISTLASGQAQLLDTQLIQQLQILIYYQQAEIKIKVLRILTNLAFNSQSLAQYLIDINNYRIAFKVMDIMENDQECKKHAAGLFMALLHVKNRQMLIDFYNRNEMINRFLSLLMINQQVWIKKIALRCIYKTLQFGEQCKNLTNNQNRPLLQILKNSQYVAYLQELQNHPSNQIHKELSQILQEFFTIQESLPI